MKPGHYTETQRLLPGCNPNGEERRSFRIAAILGIVQAMFHDLMSFEKKKLNADGLANAQQLSFRKQHFDVPISTFHHRELGHP